MITTKLVHKTEKTDKAGKAPIYLRITKHGKSSYINTKVKVEPSLWDSGKQKLKSNYKNSAAANSFIRNLVSKAETISYDLERKKTFYSAKMVKEKVLDQNSDNLITYANNWIEERKSLNIITYSSYIKYKGVVKKLNKYCDGQLRIDQFTSEYIKQYEIYLRTKIKNHPNTVFSNLSCLRALTNSLIKENIIRLNDYPFKGYKFRYEDSKRTFLTIDQINKIESVTLPEGSKLELSQHIFLFCNQTGLRIGDALHLEKKYFDGTHINYFNQKGRDFYSLKLTQKAIEIIQPYIEDDRDDTSYIFNFLHKEYQSDEELALNDQKSATSLINKNLKLIGKRCDLQISVSTHKARHSFSVNALLKGLSLEEIKGLLNHKNIQTTEIYARVVNSMKDRAIDKLEKS